MAEIKCKYEVCTCAVPHELCPHPLGRASEEETKALAERLCGPFDGHSDGFSMEVAREALRWRDETRPEQAPPAAAVPAGKDWQAEAMKHAQSALYWRERCEMLEDPVRKAQQPAAAVPDGYTLVKVQREERDGFWSFSDNEENFVGEECDTELDAIAAALDYYGDDLETVYVGKAKRIDKARLVRGDHIIEMIRDAADEEVGECAYDWPHLSNDECAELERIVMGYVLSKSPADFYSVENMRVYTREQAEEMLAAANKENGNG